MGLKEGCQSGLMEQLGKLWLVRAPEVRPVIRPGAQSDDWANPV